MHDFSHQLRSRPADEFQEDEKSTSGRSFHASDIMAPIFGTNLGGIHICKESATQEGGVKNMRGKRSLPVHKPTCFRKD